MPKEKGIARYLFSTFVNIFKIQDLWWSILRWSLSWQCSQGKIIPDQWLGDRQFLKKKKKENHNTKGKKSLAAIEKMLKRKMLYTPLCCPWCGHLRRCMEQDWKYLVLHLSIHKAECSGPLYLSSQTQKLAAKMGVALLSTEPLRRAEWWQQVQAPFPPSALPTGGLPHFLSSSW